MTTRLFILDEKQNNSYLIETTTQIPQPLATYTLISTPKKLLMAIAYELNPLYHLAYPFTLALYTLDPFKTQELNDVVSRDQN